MAIIIDDWGNFYRKEIEEFFEIPAPITFAILPQLTFSRQIAEEAHKKNFEIMLHFPMEAHNKDTKEEKPGPGAIYSSMSRNEIKIILEENLKSIPYVRGINNHMGSRITEDKNIMIVLLTLLKEKNMYYIDSLVTNKSLCMETGEEIGIKVDKRDVFLDNIDDPIYIKNQIMELASISLKRGTAIGIGHVEKKHTAKVIKEMLPYLKKNGIEIVSVSKILN
ncbi:divergent polysaccharide deacetylase family protein [Candidatus Desantisbacteria bacterium]|nr:divergent polysaccharide deacetylase family protein [Candidatus Desantisbacteria bacterium]